ncbi:GGDEF domain-containing protein [Krasilnikovia sp. MM14-A1259]|uniref:GGDEF domain-containing protein n=1 Tax=Krasilnikovia sp. MM14-A1259 TaxID=3373539 RepID=UPI0038129999
MTRRRIPRSTTMLATGLLAIGATWIADRDRLRRQLAAAHREATHDPLTGLLNRRGLDRLLLHATPRAIGLLDVDGLKAINDICGHAAGDVVLRTLAARLIHLAGPRRPVARLGGDEFVIVFPDDETQTAATVARHWRAHLAEPIHLARRAVSAPPSIGLAPVTGANTGVALSAADAAMYRAKTTGTGVQIYHATLDGPASSGDRPAHRRRDTRPRRPRLVAAAAAS